MLCRILHLSHFPALLALSLIFPNCTTHHANDASDEAQTPVHTHRVAPGDSLWSIAEQHYGDGEKYWEEIKQANKIGADGPKVGDILVLPEIPDATFLQTCVSISAKGWTVRPGPPRGRPTTIVVNPAGQEFNIGETVYNNGGWFHLNLWILEVKELSAKFLVIHVPPGASASVPMPILYIDNNNRVTLAGTIRQRFEFKPVPTENRASTFDEVKDSDFRDELFKDSDGDGIPELMEDDRWKDGGTITYFRFTEQKKFVPLWKETYKDFQMVSRERVQ